MKRTRVAALSTAAALALAAPLAQAAPSTKPQVTDPAGDALLPVKGFDIVAAQLTTTGVTTVKKVGRKTIRTYTPKTLVASMTLNDPPSTTPGTSIVFHADITACDGGYLEFQYIPGTVTGSAAEIGDVYNSGCGPDDTGTGAGQYLQVIAEVKDKTVTWAMPLSLMGSDLPLSTVFSGLKVTADYNEPVFGLLGTNVAGGLVDVAESAATWKLG